MNWACGMHRRNNKRVPNCSHKTCTDDSVLRTKRCRALACGDKTKCCCEHGNEHSAFVIEEEFIGHVIVTLFCALLTWLWCAFDNNNNNNNNNM